MEKELKLEVRKFWGLNSTFVEVTGEKLLGEAFLHTPSSWIGLNWLFKCLQKNIRVCNQLLIPIKMEHVMKEEIM